MAFLCVKLFFRRDGKFSSQHIHDNPGMKERGIHCVMDQARETRTRSSRSVKVKKNRERLKN